MSDPVIIRAKGRGPCHFILLPGLVPDGPETFLRQAFMFSKFGTTAVFTYPYEHFNLDCIIRAIEQEISEAVAIGRRVILVGVSVGGGVAIEALRRARDDGKPLAISGLMLISPLTCIDDLSSLLRRFYDNIVNEASRGDDGDPAAAVERGRNFFKLLVSNSAQSQQPTLGRFRSFFSRLSPQGFKRAGEQRIRLRIEKTLGAIPPHGAVLRTQALGQLKGTGKSGALTQAPALLLWGSKERHTLNMDGPGSGILCRPDLASRILPNCEVHWVYGKNGEEVPHASLLKHAPFFNAHLGTFLARREFAMPRLHSFRSWMSM